MKVNYRYMTAFLVFLIILIISIEAVRRDTELKESQIFLGSILPTGRLGYILTFTSINNKNLIAEGTLSLETGALYAEDFIKPPKYGELAYVDLTYSYPMSADQMLIMMMRYKEKYYSKLSSFTENKPINNDVRIVMFGNPETYPFDKYIIMGAVSCPARFRGQKKLKEIDKLKDESLCIRNFIPGLFMRKSTQIELSELKSMPFGKKKTVTEKEMEELNNEKNRFALTIERPNTQKWLTIILGIMAFGSAIYIGWVAKLDAIPFPIAGYVMALWGIRNIFRGEIGSFPLYIDYFMIFMYLIIFTGIICRIIAGSKKVSRVGYY